MKKLFLTAIALSGLLVGCAAPAPTTDAAAPAPAPAAPETAPASALTMANFEAIETGMTREQVEEILGPGEELSSSDIGGISTVLIQWTENNGMKNMNVTIQDGKVVGKAQFGLE